MNYLHKHALYLAWVISLIALLGSIYYGEVLGVEPCRLCWYQRIGMFPLALFLGIATFKNEPKIAFYCLPLIALGGLIAAYHSLMQIFPSLHLASLCGEAASCSLDGSIPFFSFFAFVAIGTLILDCQRIR
jgi:disulfide bond formation protein DsbB